MAALNMAVADIDDALTASDAGAEVASSNSPNPNRARRPNVPGFSPNQPVYNTMGGVSHLTPPRPLPGTGGRAVPSATRTGLALPPGRRARRNPLLAVSVPHPLVLVAFMLAVMLLGFLLLSNLVQWWQTWQDDLTYGRPRTFQLDAWVGHNEQGNHPTHLIAQNLDRQISIIEYPGGDPSKARVLVGPHLFGKGDELAPVKLRLVDVNGDNHVDLVATIGGQHIVYINENGQFRLLRADERLQINLSADS